MDQCSPLSFHRFGSQVKVIHFLGQVKPWYCSYNASTGQLNSPSGNQIANDFIRQWWISYTANVHPKIETVSWHLLNLTSTLSISMACIAQHCRLTVQHANQSTTAVLVLWWWRSGRRQQFATIDHRKIRRLATRTGGLPWCRLL